MKICVVGLGYIGLPTALMFAAHGNEVIGIDRNRSVIEQLNAGKIPFIEDGIDELLEKAAAGGIQFVDKLPANELYIIAVPTPYDSFSKKIDPSYVNRALRDVLDVCPKGAIVVIESTISPGTIDRFVRPVLIEKGFVSGKDIHLVHAPERIIPGNMIHELLHNNRTIGADDMEIGEKVKTAYKTFCKGEIVVTDIRTAEMTKVVENTFRDVNIAFANELMRICRQGDMDVYEIIRIANMHPRVNILQPGPGVGGHCISVDPWFLVGDYPGLATLIRHARIINDSMPEFVLERVSQIMEQNGIRDVSRVGFYGLTYKEDVDDVRESPTLQLLEKMRKHLASGIKVYDPMVQRDLVPNQYHDIDAFINDVDMIVVMVGHSELKKAPDIFSGKVILDTRNILPGHGVYHL